MKTDCLSIREDGHRMKEGVSCVREKHSCVNSLFSSEKNVKLWLCMGQEMEVHRTWSRRAFPSCSAASEGDNFCKNTVALIQMSPFLECAGHGTHLLVKPHWVHWAGAWCHLLPACKKDSPRWLMIFWKSYCKVFSGEAKEIHQCKTHILIGIISSFHFSRRNTNFKFHCPSLKVWFLKKDLWLFLLVRQALPRALGTFRKVTSVETAQLLSHSPRMFGATITKGARQLHSSDFRLFLSALVPLRIVSHAKSYFSGIWSKILLISGAKLNYS